MTNYKESGFVISSEDAKRIAMYEDDDVDGVRSQEYYVDDFYEWYYSEPETKV